MYSGTRFGHFLTAASHSRAALICTGVMGYASVALTKKLLATHSVTDKIGYLSAASLATALTIAGCWNLRNIAKAYLETSCAEYFYRRVYHYNHFAPRYAMTIPRTILYLISGVSFSIFAISKLESSSSLIEA